MVPINALQLFDEVYFATNGGPARRHDVLVFYLFQLAFQQGIAGYAAAIAYVLFVAILVLTVVQLWVGQADGPLLGMSERARRRQAIARRARRTREAQRGRLPFSPWHLVLMPLAVVMILPLVWMVVTRSRP